ncbi:MAG: hypothetical protein JST00_43180 [Deltaproteobacteria bacterium]|nr:hypothetical protein [Deltaproteobacteria bacterium]
MKLEDERIGEERRAREAREAEEHRAREEAARRERETLAAREKAEAEERERERLRTVEEEARREAMSRAAVEQARIAVEARTRAEEAERERRHEIELLRVRAETQKKPAFGGFVASGLLGAGVVVLGAVVVHFAAVKPSTDRQIAELSEARSRSETRANELSQEVRKQADELAAVKRDLEAAKVQLASAPGPQAPTTKGTGPSGPRIPVAPGPARPRLPEEKPCVDEHDPLCGTIRRGH